jgi:hypothetical protein
MSRRHHGRPHHHAQGAAAGPRRATGVSPGPGANAGPEPNGGGTTATPASRPSGAAQALSQERVLEPTLPVRPIAPDAPQPDAETSAVVPALPAALVPAQAGRADPHPAAPAIGAAPPGFATGPDRNAQCTAPQLRRFIKSRPYVPMHELRRRFGIDGGDDDVTPVRLEPGWVYVGLPAREGTLLGELLRAGEIGYELSLDPRSPIVIGVYPMRPISRG